MTEETEHIEEGVNGTEPSYLYQSEKLRDIYTKILQRNVEVEILPPPAMDKSRTYPLLILNDGQDMEGKGSEGK